MAVTNTVRAVLNTTTGRWFLWDRDGDRFEALPANGVALTATGAGTNAVHVYRITTDNGEFKSMVATALAPATLKVYVKDPASGNMVLKEAVSCTSFADNHCEFVLTGDYAAETTKYVRLDFTDGTVGSIAASFASVTLYEQRELGVANKTGVWKILTAIVSGIDDKRVRFESSDPSVCRIERGNLDLTNWQNVGDAPQQTDQYCMLVGTTKGTCTVTCIAEGDENLTAQVTVTVKVHPDDEQRPSSGGTLAADVEALLDNVRIPVRLVAPDDADALSWGGPGEVLFLRTFALPGDENDTFDIVLNFAGTVPRNLWRHVTGQTYQGCGIFLLFGIASKRELGPNGYKYRNEADDGYVYNPGNDIETGDIPELASFTSVRALNSPMLTNAGTATEALNKTLTFTTPGGVTLMVAWALRGAVGNFGKLTGYTDLPYDTDYHALMTVTSVTHHPANEAP